MNECMNANLQYFAFSLYHFEETRWIKSSKTLKEIENREFWCNIQIF